MANLSRDTNKLAVFLEGVDGHSLAATYYFKDEVEKLIGHSITDHKEAAKELKHLVDNKDPKAKALRQRSKPVSFGLAYGAFPKKVSESIKCSLEEAERIFDAYHNEMYPGITDYRENYVLPTVIEEGQLHLGLGFYIKSDDAERDIRTLNNASVQFWSILSVLTINKLHALIDETGLDQDIFITSTIYDSIYFEVREDPKIIKWLNDRVVPIMEQDFMKDQILKNEARLELGTSWADLVEISKNADIHEIKQVLASLNKG